MLYKIDNNYYVKVGMKYAKVDFKIEKDNVSLQPTSIYVEQTSDMVVKEQPFNDSFKESLIKKLSNDNKGSEQNTKINYKR